MQSPWPSPLPPGEQPAGPPSPFPLPPSIGPPELLVLPMPDCGPDCMGAPPALAPYGTNIWPQGGRCCNPDKIVFRFPRISSSAATLASSCARGGRGGLVVLQYILNEIELPDRILDRRVH